MEDQELIDKLYQEGLDAKEDELADKVYRYHEQLIDDGQPAWHARDLTQQAFPDIDIERYIAQ